MSCAIWGQTNIAWKNANWRWSECGGLPTPPLPPSSSVVDYRLGVDATTLIQPWQAEEQWNPYRAADEEQKRRRQKHLIKLICKINGIEFDEEKSTGDYRVTVGDIKMIVKKTNIDLGLKE